MEPIKPRKSKHSDKERYNTNSGMNAANTNTNIDAANCYPGAGGGGRNACCGGGGRGAAGNPYCSPYPPPAAGLPPAGYGGCGSYGCMCSQDSAYPSPSTSMASEIYARQRALCYDDPCDRTGVFDGRAPNPAAACPPASYDCKRRGGLMNPYSLGFPNSNSVHSFDCPQRGRSQAVPGYPPVSRNYDYGLYDCPRGTCQHRY